MNKLIIWVEEGGRNVGLRINEWIGWVEGSGELVGLRMNKCMWWVDEKNGGKCKIMNEWWIVWVELWLKES